VHEYLQSVASIEGFQNGSILNFCRVAYDLCPFLYEGTVNTPYVVLIA